MLKLVTITFNHYLTKHDLFEDILDKSCLEFSNDLVYNQFFKELSEFIDIINVIWKHRVKSNRLKKNGSLDLKPYLLNDYIRYVYEVLNIRNLIPFPEYKYVILSDWLDFDIKDLDF